MRTRCPLAPAPVLALVAMLLALAAPTLATPALAFTDSAGNAFVDSAPPSVTDADLYWAGDELSLDNATVGADVLAAGRTVTLSSTSVGGSVRVAAQDIRLDNVDVRRAVTVAGQHVFLGRDSRASSLYAAAGDVTIAGVAGTGSVIADTLTVTGTVKGDLTVRARRLVLGPTARIEGTLSATLDEQPARDAAAYVADDSAVVVRPKRASSSPAPMEQLRGIVITCLMALALTWLLPVTVDGAAVLTKRRPLAVAVAGAVAFLVAPVVLLAAIWLAVGSLAMALSGTALVIAFVAVPLAAASLTRLVRPDWNRFAAAAVGGVVAGVVCSLPTAGIVAGLACALWMMGCIAIAIREQMRAPAAHGGDAAALPPAGGCGRGCDHADGHDSADGCACDHRPDDAPRPPGSQSR